MAGACAYSFSAQINSRSAGKNAVQVAAYQSREKLIDHKTGIVYDYSRNRNLSEVVFKGIYAYDAPEPWQGREQLWNTVEATETRKNSQLARTIVAALPHQLTDEQRQRLVTDFVRENFMRKGMIADVAIHRPGRDEDDRNEHVHIMLTMRGHDKDGFQENRYQARQWNDKELLGKWKNGFAAECANQLEKSGFTVEADRWRVGYLDKEGQAAEAIKRKDFDFAIDCLRDEPEQRRHGKPRDIEVTLTADDRKQLIADIRELAQGWKDVEARRAAEREQGADRQAQDAANENARPIEHDMRAASRETTEPAGGEIANPGAAIVIEAKSPEAETTAKAEQEGASGLDKVGAGVVAAAEFVAETIVKPIAKAIEIAADMIAPTAPPTKEQARLNRIAANENAEVREVRADEKAKLDAANKQNAQTHQETEQQRTDQEGIVRRRRERDDDYGRERERDR